MGKHKIAWVIIVLLVIAAVIFFVFREKPKKPIPGIRSGDQNEQRFEPHFRHDGTLSFVSPDGEMLSRIAIEVADSESEQSQGLMFRRSMADSCGMLFIFGEEEPRSFWMKNTFIPLDILFVNKDFRILNIVSSTVPFSEASVPSAGPAMYVVEVNAGYTARNNIKAGCKINYQLIALP